MIVIMFCAAILVFTLMYFVPGDPARLQLGVDIPENILQAKRHELGIDRPYIVQLGSFLYQAFLKLDFGYSWKYGVSVMDELITRLPRTLAIGIPAMLKCDNRYRAGDIFRNTRRKMAGFPYYGDCHGICISTEFLGGFDVYSLICT